LNLGLRLTKDEEKHLAKRPTNDPAAYLLFREGRYYWDKGTPESLDLAIKHFQAAINKDPNFALAYAWQTQAYLLLMHFRPVEEIWPRAKESASRALLADPHLAEGHAALGSGLFFAEQDCQQAHLWTRRFQDAPAQARKTVEISRTLLHNHVSLGLAYENLRQYDAAVTALQEALKISRDHPYFLGFLGYTYALAGNRSEAERILNKLRELSPSQRGWAYAMATVYTGLGNKDQAIFFRAK
jgi:tetratricopeptide (TPR) repeat protein